MTYGMYPLGL